MNIVANRNRLFARTLVAANLAVGALLVHGVAFAGPPYTTDDPEPIEYRHWELYLSSQHNLWGSGSSGVTPGWSGVGPFFEVNYGVIRDVQLHMIAPMAYSVPGQGPSHYGFGDMELGTKVRFIHEGKWMPQIGTYPMLEVPTGSKDKGLGNGSAQIFVPIWIQKRFGQWTTYGGGGPWFDFGSGHYLWWYLGWQVQYRICSALTVGAEVFHWTPKLPGEHGDTRFNVGAIVDFSPVHHLLLSAGRSIAGPNQFQAYVGYLATIGPSEQPEPH